MNEDQNAPQDSDVQPEAPQEEEQAATGEEAAPEQEETQEQEQPSEEVDISEFAAERYQTQPSAQENPLVDEVAQELSQLPADEYGTVDSKAAAEWFAQKLGQAETRAAERAIQAANQAVMGNLAEVNQQRQLIDKFPEVKSDRGLMEDIFDKRDAAALRGESLTLMQAAERVLGRTNQARDEGAQSQRRRTTIQAAAHLETASSKGDSKRTTPNLMDKEARHELLKQYVQSELDSGKIQIPS